MGDVTVKRLAEADPYRGPHELEGERGVKLLAIGATPGKAYAPRG